MFNPFGSNRLGREYDNEPIAAIQSSPDFIVPFSCPSNMRGAVPILNTGLFEGASQLLNENAIAR
jgi:hypothetical protein